MLVSGTIFVTVANSLWHVGTINNAISAVPVSATRPSKGRGVGPFAATAVSNLVPFTGARSI